METIGLWWQLIPALVLSGVGAWLLGGIYGQARTMIRGFAGGMLCVIAGCFMHWWAKVQISDTGYMWFADSVIVLSYVLFPATKVVPAFKVMPSITVEEDKQTAKGINGKSDIADADELIRASMLEDIAKQGKE